MLPLVIGAGVALAKKGALQAAGRGLRKIGSAIARKIGKGGRAVAKIAGTTAVGAVGAETALSGGRMLINNFTGKGGLPAMPAPGGYNMPAMPGGGQSSVPMVQGKYGNLPEVLAIDHPNVRTFHRAPKGYVMVKDPATGQYYGAVRRDVARRAGLWKPSAKPPISATEWKHYKSAERIAKKLKKIAGKEFRKHKTVSHTCRSKKK